MSWRSRNGNRKWLVIIMIYQSSLTNFAISFYLDEKDRGYASHQNFGQLKEQKKLL